jgi:hypothetical protein
MQEQQKNMRIGLFYALISLFWMSLYAYQPLLSTTAATSWRKRRHGGQYFGFLRLDAADFAHSAGRFKR